MVNPSTLSTINPFKINNLRSSLLIYIEASQPDKSPRFIPASFSKAWRMPSPPVSSSKKARSKYQAVVITEYLDMETGEILPASTVKSHRDFWPEVHMGERCAQRGTIISSLRKEVRHFALFVLRFANQRRGITPGIETLTRWYAKLHNCQAQHVRRYVPKLKEAGILAGDALLAPIFQISGKHLPAKAHLAEDATASLKFLRLAVKRQSLPHIPTPRWLSDLEAQTRLLLEGIREKVRASRGTSKDWASSYECEEMTY